MRLTFSTSLDGDFSPFIIAVHGTGRKDDAQSHERKVDYGVEGRFIKELIMINDQKKRELSSDRISSMFLKVSQLIKPSFHDSQLNNV